MSHTRYKLGKEAADSVELKCLLISNGVAVDREVYSAFGTGYRLSPSPLTCNSFLLSGGANVHLTDVRNTPFRLKLSDGKPTLCYGEDFLDYVTFHKPTDFYRQHTSSGLPFAGNAVLQGCDFVSFQCLWHCEYAAAGAPCQFCFSGDYFAQLAQKGLPQPAAVPAPDLAEIVRYAVQSGDANSVQLTGGSTFAGAAEHRHLAGYLQALAGSGIHLAGETLLYITPPADLACVDEYFALGASRIACSLEVWDEARAKIITPGKMRFTTRPRHLKALTYIAEKYGKNRAFSNFIIGLESVETLRQGATWLAERGIIPSASVWMPFNRPVMGSTAAPTLSYFRRVKELLAELYLKHNLTPSGGCGLNVCIEKDVFLEKCASACC